MRDRVIQPQKLSRATFYRFLAANPDLAAGLDPETSGEKELKRFSRQFINELWQTDLMYGPYLKVGKAKQQTYLIAFIDDASRLITHGQFFFSQNFSALRMAFKEAVLKRGVPKMDSLSKKDTKMAPAAHLNGDHENGLFSFALIRGPEKQKNADGNHCWKMVSFCC